MHRNGTIWVRKVHKCTHQTENQSAAVEVEALCSASVHFTAKRTVISRILTCESIALDGSQHQAAVTTSAKQPRQQETHMCPRRKGQTPAFPKPLLSGAQLFDKMSVIFLFFQDEHHPVAEHQWCVERAFDWLLLVHIDLRPAQLVDR